MSETILWPSSLPCGFVDGGGAETVLAPKHTFEPEIGSPITRPKGTLRQFNWEVEQVMTRDQLEIFEQFFRDTLNSGALPFYMTHPRLNRQVKCRIMGDEAYSVRRFGSKVRVAYTLRVTR